jgi:hypothetical protein
MEMSGQPYVSDVSAILPPGKVLPQYPLNRGLGGPQSRSGPFGGRTTPALAGNLMPNFPAFNYVTG